MKRIFSLLSLLFISFSLLLKCSAVSISEEFNIDIPAFTYLNLVTDESEKKHEVSVQLGENKSPAQISLRGLTSKELGLLSRAKRIPFELKFESSDSLPSKLKNKTLKFINSNTLYRLLAEYIALDLFESFGIPTPAHEIVFVSFNGVDYGLYIAVEDVNKNFFKKHYSGKIGSVLKSIPDYREDKVSLYSSWFDIVFQKVDGTLHTYDNMINAFDSGAGFEEYINVDEWLRFFACTSAIGGNDSIFDVITNFILYDNNAKIELIPWDLSEAFSGKETSNGIDYYYNHGIKSSNQLLDLFLSFPEYKQKYHDYIGEICNGFLEPEKFDTYFMELVESLAPFWSRDHSTGLITDSAKDELFSGSMDSYLNLLPFIKEHRLNLLSQLKGTSHAFLANPYYTEVYKRTDIKSVMRMIEEYTPQIDTRLPLKIFFSSNKWFTSEQKKLTIRIILFTLAFAAVFLVVFKLVKKTLKGKNSKTRKNAKRAKVKKRSLKSKKGKK